MSKPVSKDSRNKTLKLLDEPEPDDSIQREFLDFHAQNPHILKFLVHYTFQAVREIKKRGVENPQYSISAVIERVRWHVNFEVKGYKDFKLNNDFRSRYSRLIQRQVPKLRGVFNIRPIQSQKERQVSNEEIRQHAIKQRQERDGDATGQPNQQR